MTVTDVITDSLVTIGEYGQGESVSTDDLNYCFNRLNAMLDSWSTERLSLYSVYNAQFTLVASQQDYTLGPSGEFTTIGRPVAIQTASIIIPGTTIRNRMNMLTSKQWAAIPELGLTGLLPTDAYMDGNYPNAGFHVWPIPSGTPNIELYYWAELWQYATLVDTITVPPGYVDAIKFQLALHIAPAYNKPIDPAIVQLANSKKQAIQTINAQILAGSFGESRTLHGPNIGAPVPPALTPMGQGGEPGPVNF